MEEWTKRTEEVVREQKTNPSRGLSEREADERLKQVGENVLETGKKPPSLLCRFWDNSMTLWYYCCWLRRAFRCCFPCRKGSYRGIR